MVRTKKTSIFSVFFRGKLFRSTNRDSNESNDVIMVYKMVKIYFLIKLPRMGFFSFGFR